ncbi:MAG: hypothetical protein ACXWZZ_15930, partial [Solirubrobacteraceae bacterium]
MLADAVGEARCCLEILEARLDSPTPAARVAHRDAAGFRLGLTPQLHMTYLMRRASRGCRVGVTRTYTDGQIKPVIGLQQRCNHEHGDPAWVVSVHPSEAEA